MWMQKNTLVLRLNKGISCQEKGDKNCSFDQLWPRPPLATLCPRHWILLFFESTIMGKTADLVMVQKTIITEWSVMVQKRVITESGGVGGGGAVEGVLYQSMLNAKLTGRNYFGRKMCTSNNDDCKLENTVKQSRFKHLGELHKEWTEAGVSASRVTTLRHLREKGYQDTSEPETPSEASYLG